MNSRGSYWNRAARRSGGPRHAEIIIPQIVVCECGKQSEFGLLPKYIVEGIEVATCSSCKGVLFVRTPDGWRAAPTPGEET